MQWRQQEARLYDFPILLNAKPIFKNQCDEEHGTYFSYTVPVDRNDAVTFYEQEMERLGWRLFSRFDHDEILLNFEKPTKVCSISLRPQKNNLLVVVFYKAKY